MEMGNNLENAQIVDSFGDESMIATMADEPWPFDGKNVSNLTLIYGPQRDPLYIVIPITVIYMLIFVTGIVGNISTCIVISKNKSMHTATNYYLFSLAISDFLLLISGVPQEVYHECIHTFPRIYYM